MKTYIWALPTRIFHWLLAISFAIAFIISDFEELQNLHFAFGLFVGTIIFFRLIYGIIGPKYSDFRSFPVGLKSQKEFVKTFFSKTKVYSGHNPAASLVMLSIFLVGLGCSISGYLIYTTENNLLQLNLNDDFLEEIHEIAANLFLFLVGIHLLGIIFDLVFHSKTETLKSIFTGYKKVVDENVKLNKTQKFFSILWLIIPLLIFYYALGFKNTESTNDKAGNIKTEQYENEEDDD